MPVYRQPLRIKHKVNLRIITAIPTNVDDALASPDAHHIYSSKFQRGCTNKRLPPTTKRAEDPLLDRNAGLDYPIITPPSFSTEPEPTNLLKSFHDVIPYVTIALADGNYNPFTVRVPSTTFYEPMSPTHSIPFTHVLRVLYADPSPDDGMVLEGGMSWPQYDDRTGVAVLNLVIPQKAVDNYLVTGDEDIGGEDDEWHRTLERNVTLLSNNQLLMARDFLCLALPFFNQDDWKAMKSADAVHVLMTAPLRSSSMKEVDPESSSATPHRTTRQEAVAACDLLSIVLCYLGQCSGQKTKQVIKRLELDLVTSEEQGKDVHLWIDRVGTEGWPVLDRIAKLG